MADKTLINLATGLEDAERVLVAFLVGGAALETGRPTARPPSARWSAWEPRRRAL